MSYLKSTKCLKSPTYQRGGKSRVNRVQCDLCAFKLDNKLGYISVRKLFILNLLMKV